MDLFIYLFITQTEIWIQTLLEINVTCLEFSLLDRREIFLKMNRNIQYSV